MREDPRLNSIFSEADPQALMFLAVYATIPPADAPRAMMHALQSLERAPQEDLILLTLTEADQERATAKGCLHSLRLMVSLNGLLIREARTIVTGILDKLIPLFEEWDTQQTN